jgi:hypothetical protein
VTNALSEEPPFRRKFSAVYDVLDHGEVDLAELGKVLYESQPADCETMAGYEVYAVDATPNPRPEAETLPERVLLKADKDTPAVPGWKFSWLVRLVQRETSWVAPQAVDRIPADSTANQVAGAQVAALDKQSSRPKVAVLDSGYFNHLFLALCVALQTVILLVRMRHNCTLYEQPAPKPPKSKGAPRKHGPKFKLGQPTRTPDRTATLPLGDLTVVLTAWHGLHLKKVATLVGMALRVEFQKADGTPRYQRPLWLFWTGPLTVALGDVCLMYLWRFAIEIVFTQMTKGRLFAGGRGWDHVADFHFGIVDDDAVNQQLYQLSALSESKLRQGGLQTPAKVFDAGGELGGVQLLLGLRLELPYLLRQAALRLGEFLPLALELVPADHLGQVHLEQARLLALQLCQGASQGTLPILQRLGKPVTRLGACQFMGDEGRIGQ